MRWPSRKRTLKPAPKPKPPPPGTTGYSTSTRPSPCSDEMLIGITVKPSSPTSSKAVPGFALAIASLNTSTIGVLGSALVPLGNMRSKRIGSASTISPSLGTEAGAPPRAPPSPWDEQSPPKTQAGLSQEGNANAKAAADSKDWVRRRMGRGRTWTRGRLSSSLLEAPLPSAVTDGGLGS